MRKVIYGKMECLVCLAVLYYNGENLCLRGGKEHLDCYIYTENGSKNHSGRFMELHVGDKVVPICKILVIDITATPGSAPQ